MFKKKICNGIYLLLVIIFIACGTNSDKEVIGEWTIVSNVHIRNNSKGTEKIINGKKIEFLSDKTYVAPDLWGAGKWTFLEDGRIKIEIPVNIVAFGTIGDRDDLNRMVISKSYSPEDQHIFVLKKKRN